MAQVALKNDAFGVPAILFFVFSAQAPLTGVVGTSAFAVGLGNGAGAPTAFVAVGLVIVLFAVGFTSITKHVDCHGGFFAVIRSGLGRRIGTGGSMLAILSYSAVQLAMYALLGVSVAGAIARRGGPEIPWWIVAFVAIAIVWMLGVRKIELGARFLAVLVSLEFLLLFAFALGVLVTKGIGAVDLGASFVPSAFLAGAPGVAIMFAIASMFGFESTAIYSREAKNPNKTVPRATYIAVVAIVAFYAFQTLMVVTYYGAQHSQGAALDSLLADPATFVLNPLIDVLGPWTATAAEFLLCTSLLAGVLAFHNMIIRYFHALAVEGLLPMRVAYTNRFHAPWVASALQSLIAGAVVALFAILRLDPLATLFTWFAGLAVVALVLLYILSSVAVIVYFHRRQLDTSRWKTAVAPALASLLMVGVLALVVSNFESLIRADSVTEATLLAVVPTVFIVGLAIGGRGRDVLPQDDELQPTSVQ